MNSFFLYYIGKIYHLYLFIRNIKIKLNIFGRKKITLVVLCLPHISTMVNKKINITNIFVSEKIL